MSRVDLAAVLTGRAQDSARPPEGRTVAVVRCPCGSKLATVHAAEAGHVVWVAPCAYTRAHTAAMLLDQALRDLEELAELTEQGQGEAAESLEVVGALVDAATPEDVARVVPPLRLPATLHGLASIAAAARTEEARAAAAGTVPNHLGGLDVPCRSCQRLWYVGNDLRAWAETLPHDRGGTVVAGDRPPMRAQVIGWPEAGLASRVALYRRMVGVLTSESTTA